MTENSTIAVAYYRTSSAANVGEDKDSLRRQQSAVRAYAKARGLYIVEEFYDAAVSGADPVHQRPGFKLMLEYMSGNGARVVLVENAGRFARDLIVQLTGHDFLKGLGFELIAVDVPGHFAEDTPTAVLIRQVLGAFSQFEKASLVAKLKAARDKVRAKTGRCEGPKPPPAALVKEARRLARRSPKTGARRSLKVIADELAQAGHRSPTTGRAYSREGIRLLLARAS